MEYVDYSYYKNEYGGKLPVDVFNELVVKESRNLDAPTFYRLQDDAYPKTDDDWEKVKYCLSEMIDLQNEYNEKLENIKSSIPVGVTSENIDGFAKSYVTDQDITKLTEDFDKERKKIIRGRLGITGLLYRG